MFFIRCCWDALFLFSFLLAWIFELIAVLLILQPELVRRVEEDLLNINAGGTAENIDILSCICIEFYFYYFLLLFLLSVYKARVLSNGGSSFHTKTVNGCAVLWIEWFVKGTQMQLRFCAAIRFILGNSNFAKSINWTFLNRMSYMLKQLSKRKMEMLVLVVQVKGLHPNPKTNLMFQSLVQMLGSLTEVILMNLMIQFDTTPLVDDDLCNWMKLCIYYGHLILFL